MVTPWHRPGAATNLLLSSALTLTMAACSGGNAADPDKASDDATSTAGKGGGQAGDGQTSGTAGTPASGGQTGTAGSGGQKPTLEPPVGPTVIDENACASQTEVTVARTPIRRISRAEFNNAVRDLFGDDSRPARDGTFPPDERVGSFVSNSLSLPTPVNNEQFLTAAESVGKRAAENLAAVTGCAGPEDAACIETFLGSAAKRAFRGAATDAALEKITTFYRDAVSQLGAELGFEAAVEAILLDPSFLYVLEFGSPQGSVSRLSGLEVAGRLASFLWRSVPSPELIQDAETGQLDTPEGVRQLAASMLDDPKAELMAEDFALQWLAIDRLHGLNSGDAAFTDTVREAMRAETLSTVNQAMLSGSLTGLLTAPAAPAAPLDQFYGPGDRPGVLTNGSVMVANPGPIKRGRLVRQQIMCDTIPEPPQGVEMRPEAQEGTTTNDLLRQHAEDPQCWGCHQYMDPVGVGFAFYDDLGRYSETEDGLPLSVEGEFIRGTVSPLEGPFSGASEMMSMLAGETFIHKCFATQMLRFALGRSEQKADACSLSQAYADFAESSLSIRDLLLAITASDAFLHRNTVNSGGACQ